MADRIRLTVFPLAASTELLPQAAAWYETAVGVPPEEETIQRGVAHEAVGTLDNLRYALAVAPFRMDLRITPHFPPDQQPTGWLATDFESALNALTSAFARLCPELPAAKRIAIGLSLSQPCSTIPDALAILQQFLPRMTIEIDNTFDFLYQVNHPTQSRVLPELGLNRLAKWSVGAQQYLVFQVNPGSAATSEQATRTLHAARLELDLNTDATRQTPIPPELLHDVGLELVEWATPIATSEVQF